MLEWILGLELIIHYFGASSCVIELLKALCKLPARPGPYMTLYGLSTSYNRFVLPPSSQTMVFVSATVVQGAAGRKFILWLMLIIGYGMQ